jgi:uncharacterized phage protein (predicted DNA packaging)
VLNVIEEIKRELRISHNKFDEDIAGQIAEAKLKLKISGLASSKINENDPLIRRAIIVYVKANYESDINKAVRYQQSYDNLVIHLALSSDYNTEMSDNNV